MVQLSTQSAANTRQSKIAAMVSFEELLYGQICIEIKKNFPIRGDTKKDYEDEFIEWSFELISQHFINTEIGYGILHLTSLLEYFPTCSSLRVKQELIRTGYFIQLIRVLLFDSIIDSEDFKDYNKELSPLRYKINKAEDDLKSNRRYLCQKHIRECFSGRLSLFKKMSYRMFKKDEYSFWRISDILEDESSKDSTPIPRLLTDISSKCVVKDNCILLSDRISDAEEVPKNETASDILDEDALIILKECTEYMERVEAEKRETNRRCGVSDELISDRLEPVEFILSSSFLLPYAVRSYEEAAVETYKYTETISKRRNVLPTHSTRKGMFSFESSSCKKIVLFMINIFEFLTIYSSENVKVKIVVDSKRVNLHYEIDMNIYNLYPMVESQGLEHLTTLNSISQVRCEESLIFGKLICKNPEIVHNIIEESNNVLVNKNSSCLPFSKQKTKYCFIMREEQYTKPSLESCLFGNLEGNSDWDIKYPAKDGKSKALLNLLAEFIRRTEDVEFLNYSKDICRKACEDILLIHKDDQERYKLILNEYSKLLDDQSTGDLHEDLREYYSKYKSCSEEVQDNVEFLKTQRKCIEVFEEYILGCINQSREETVLNLILTLALYNDLTYRDLVFRTLLQLRNTIKEKMSKNEEENLATLVIATLKLNQLKYAYFVKLCMREVLTIIKNF